jgi:hypothetical protein
MGKQNATPEESAREAQKRAAIKAQREEADRKKAEHDAEVKRIAEEGNKRRAAALEASKNMGKNDKQ